MSEKLSMPQERLLRWLGRFSASLEKAWDVTRELSLPGISESLGVVRSALNVPLAALEKRGLVFKRMAHVIGGGSRRRNVYHLTEQGRILLATLGEDTSTPRKSASEGKLYGHAPTLGTMYGRSSLIDQVCEQMKNERSVYLSGLPGIGKTTVALSVAQRMVSEGMNVRWCTADSFSDFQSLCVDMGLSDEVLNDSEAFAEYLSQHHDDEIFVFDDVHLISARHASTFASICQQILQHQGPSLMFIGRELMVGFEAINRIPIPPMRSDDATQLLGDSYAEEETLHVVERLGGHPLAIQMYQNTTSLPEENADIQSYVENVVLSMLDTSTRSDMDHIVVLPHPVEADKIYNKNIVGILDDHAFLRWTGDMKKMEIQHLVRNVRRTSLTDDEKRELHRQGVEHWAARAETYDDHIVLLFHRIHARLEDIENHCSQAYERLSSSNSHSLAVLLEQAIETSPHTSHLHYLAAKVALERCEPQHAHHHLDAIDDESSANEIRIGIAYLEGRIQDAERGIEDGFEYGTQHQKNQLALSAASRLLDDRISTELSKDAVKQIKTYLSKIVLPDDAERRSVTVVALTMVQHSLALGELNFEKAAELRERLASISSSDDAFIQALAAKSLLVQLEQGIVQHDEVVNATLQAIDVQSNTLHKEALKLSLIETLLKENNSLARAHFLQTAKFDFTSSSMLAHRLQARWWFCKSQIQPNAQRIALREAITLNRAAGCPRAAKQLEAKLHNLL